MRVRAGVFGAALILAFAAASCASVDIPKRGFVTRYFADSYLQDSVRTTNDFTGRHLHPTIDTFAATGPLPTTPNASGPPGISSSLAQTLRSCQRTAYERASDVAFQGFGEATQKSVFDKTYADCLAWRRNH